MSKYQLIHLLAKCLSPSKAKRFLEKEDAEPPKGGSRPLSRSHSPGKGPGEGGDTTAQLVAAIHEWVDAPWTLADERMIYALEKAQTMDSSPPSFTHTGPELVSLGADLGLGGGGWGD